jgi:hypothetical protein
MVCNRARFELGVERTQFFQQFFYLSSLVLVLSFLFIFVGSFSQKPLNQFVFSVLTAI